MEKYNLDKLVKVVVNDFYQSKSYCFKRAKRLFGILIRKEGYYGGLWNSYIGTEVPKNHVRKGDLVYEIPDVILVYQGNISKRYYFDSYQEATVFAYNLTNGHNWIK